MSLNREHSLEDREEREQMLKIQSLEYDDEPDDQLNLQPQISVNQENEISSTD
jgi:hypothetical protein